MQVHTFYNSLSDATRTVIDASAGCALMKKTTDQTYEILDDTATNSNQWPKDRLTPGKAVGGADNEVLSNLVNNVGYRKCCSDQAMGVMRILRRIVQ